MHHRRSSSAVPMSRPGESTRIRPRHRVMATVATVVLLASSLILATVVARTPEIDKTVGFAPGGSVFVSVEGAADGDGTLDHPLDLATALSAETPVRPGMTLWLRGGTYSGAFRSDLTGTEQQPIVVRPYPGEHVAIDSAPFGKPALMIYGAWTTYRDFEVFNSNPIRHSSQQNSSQPTDLPRGQGVVVHAPHTRVVNLVLHDLAGGLDIWSDAIDGEAYGNIIYDNGWQAGDRSNGHGVYTQNREGIRRLRENVIFNQFATGIHAYGSDAASLDNITLEGNVVFNNGVFGQKYDHNILIGGGRTATHPVLIANHTYYSSGRGLKFGQNNVGYLAGCTELEARDNYFVAAEFGFSLEMVNCGGSVRHNTFLGELRLVEGKTLIDDPSVRARFPENTFVDRPPDAAEVFVRSNEYQRGRAHVIVYNWRRSATADVDLAQARLAPGDRYEIRDAQNYFNSPVLSGTFDGALVQLPLKNLKAVKPIGDGITAPFHTSPEFVVFVVSPVTETSSLWSWARRLVRHGL